MRQNLDRPLLGAAACLGLLGTAMLYAAGDGHWQPWALKHLLRLLGGAALAALCAALPPRVWYRPAYAVYLLSLGLLAAVPFLGGARKGAERWISVGGFQMQPSEPAKLALILCLARFFHDAERMKTAPFVRYFGAAVLIALPTLAVLKQPDLGSAVLLAGTGAAVMFAAGISVWHLLLPIFAGAAALPFLYARLHDYQRRRIDVFLDPDLDRLGKGYHIYQSKIAIGAGGTFGRGFMNGTQSRLDFLPEKHTDFAFTAFSEQCGFVGGLLLLLLFGFLLIRLTLSAQRTQHVFGRLVTSGVGAMLFAHVFVNIGMVAGLLPVVGVPLPFISYGGTSMLTFLWAFGVVMGGAGRPRPPHER